MKVVNVLFKYYFEKEKNIGDIETLSEAGKEAGLDQDKVG
jgi:predicted DsbA family dithiol-disulfide isomerase